MSTLKTTASYLPKRAADKAETPAAPEADEKDVKRQTFYLPVGVHDMLRETAFSKRISMQEIFRRAVDDWLAKEGLPSWDEAKRTGGR